VAVGAGRVGLLPASLVDDVTRRLSPIPRQEGPALAAVGEGLVALRAAVAGIGSRRQLVLPLGSVRVRNAHVADAGDATALLALGGHG